VASLNPIRLKLSEKLLDWTYFHRFFDERTRDELAIQLRELRQLRGLSQVKFAAESGMKQSAVSRIEQSDYSGWTYKTLLRAAMTLKARLKIELIPAERVIADYEHREAAQAAQQFFLQINAASSIFSDSGVDDFRQGPEAVDGSQLEKVATADNGYVDDGGRSYLYEEGEAALAMQHGPLVLKSTGRYVQ
jgi:transcriptional regulator with XRE-family HTH domain